MSERELLNSLNFMTEFMNFACDGLQDFACGMLSNCGGPLGYVPIGRSSWTRVRLMILLYLDCDIAFPSPAFARAGDGAAHGA